MRINTNTAAMNTYSNLTSANASKSNSLAKLSSGLRINKAGDDAAGLAISEKMKNQISGMTQASRNAQDGISLIQTAEGALSETHSILNRMRDLTVQSANGTNTDDDKTAIQAELTSLTEEVDRIAGDTKFNTQGLLNGDLKVDSKNQQIIVDDYNSKVGKTSGVGIDTTDASGEKMFDDLKALKTSGVGSTKEDIKIANEIVANYNANSNEGADVDLAGLIGKISSDPGTFKAITSGTSANDLKAVTDAVNKYNETLKIDKNDLRDVSKLDKAAIEKSATKAFTTASTPLVPVATTIDDLKVNGSTTFSFQIGANAGEKIGVEIKNMSASGLGISDINVASGEQKTDDILGQLDDAISEVSSQRANLGAVQNRLDHTVSNLATTKENLSEANSRITDVDMAEEMMSFTKSNILSQASTSMLAQANQMPQSVLSLLQ